MHLVYRIFNKFHLILIIFFSDVPIKSSRHFSCQRSSPDILSKDEKDIFQCDESALVSDEPEGIKFHQNGVYRITFTGLLKSASNSSIEVLIQRVRGLEKKIIGQSKITMEMFQGEPDLGLSTSIFMVEKLEMGDIIGIEQVVLGNNSFLRSSEWKLLRLEGHLIEEEGFLCEKDNERMECSQNSKKIDNIKITESGFYELALHGQVVLVSIFSRL